MIGQPASRPNPSIENLTVETPYLLPLASSMVISVVSSDEVPKLPRQCQSSTIHSFTLASPPTLFKFRPRHALAALNHTSPCLSILPYHTRVFGLRGLITTATTFTRSTTICATDRCCSLIRARVSGPFSAAERDRFSRKQILGSVRGYADPEGKGGRPASASRQVGKGAYRSWRPLSLKNRSAGTNFSDEPDSGHHKISESSIVQDRSVRLAQRQPSRNISSKSGQQAARGRSKSGLSRILDAIFQSHLKNIIPQKQNPALSSEDETQYRGRIILSTPEHCKRSKTIHDLPPRQLMMFSYFQFLSTPTVDSGSLILLHFDTKRYLFGHASEGTTRVLLDHNVKLANMKDIFLTGRTEWANTGGLLGIVLSLADAVTQSAGNTSRVKTPPRKDVGIYGGPNLMHLVATARHFTFRKGMPLNVHEHQENETSHAEKPMFSDENIKVWAMSLSPNTRHSPDSGRSPRKRSFEDFIEFETTSGLENLTSLDREGSDREIRKGIVKEMFDSAWSLDTLYETNLADVKFPATLFFRNTETKRIELYKGILPHEEGFADHPPITVLVRKPWPAAEIHTLPKTTVSREAISYIVKDHDQRGVFNAKRAKELKVRPGPDFSKLSHGESVLSMDGNTVTSDMVLGEPRRSIGSAILDIPSPDYVDALVGRSEWKDEIFMKGVVNAMWILGPGVVTNQKWLEFVRSMTSLEHTVICPETSPNTITYVDASVDSIHRHAMDPAHYPVPVFESSTPQEFGLRQNDDNIKHASRGMRLQMRPIRETKTLDVQPTFNLSEVIKATPKAVVELGLQVRQQIESELAKNGVEDFPGRDVEIIPLGTGSALPSKYRNVSATLVRVPNYGSYLLDAGENTLGQLKRVFSADELRQVLQELKMIWISHMHADHHLGITSVIKAWWNEVHGGQSSHSIEDRDVEGVTEDQLTRLLNAQRHLTIAAEPSMIHWLKEYSGVESFGYEKLFPITVSTEKINYTPANRLYYNDLPLDFSTENTSLSSALQETTGLKELAACPVSHCRGAKGVAMTFSDGFKMSYSGDTRPSERLAFIGAGSTVLIHEATFDDELSGDAKAKAHSTTSEALAVALKMRCRRVMLTHFSQRYQKLPVLDMWNVGAALNGLGGPGLDLHISPQEEEMEANMDGPVDAAVQGSRSGQDNHDQDASIPLSSTKPTYKREKTYDPEPNLDPTTASSIPPKTDSQDPTDTTLTHHKSTSHLNHPPATPPSIKSLNQDLQSLDIKVAVAFDYMRVKVGEIEHIERYRPALSELYEAELEDQKRDSRRRDEVGGKKESVTGIGSVAAD